jgi:hypothetical protein
MSTRVMLLPSSKNTERARIVALPSDMSDKEAVRSITGLIGAIQQESDDYSWEEDILPKLEEHGFQSVETCIGPAWE